MSRNNGAQSKKDLNLLALGGLATRYAGGGGNVWYFLVLAQGRPPAIRQTIEPGRLWSWVMKNLVVSVVA